MNRVLMASSQTRRPLGHKVIYCLFWHNRSNPAEWYRVVPNKRFSTKNRRRRDRNKTSSLIYEYAWNVFKIVNSNSNCFKSFFLLFSIRIYNQKLLLTQNSVYVPLQVYLVECFADILVFHGIPRHLLTLFSLVQRTVAVLRDHKFIIKK